MYSSIFKLIRLYAHTKNLEHIFRELLFADDACLIDNSEWALQRQTECFAETAIFFWFTGESIIGQTILPICEREYLHQAFNCIGETKLKSVKKFKRFGCIIFSNSEINKDKVSIKQTVLLAGFGKIKK